MEMTSVTAAWIVVIGSILASLGIMLYFAWQRVSKPASPVVPEPVELDDDPDYKRQDAEAHGCYDMTEDQRLDDPRHGQGDR